MPVAAAIAALPEAQRAIAEPLAALLLAVGPAGSVVAAIKWNSPSFQEVRSGLFFATFQFPVKKGQPTGVGLRLVLHRDAKKRASPSASPPIAATLGELLGADRALIPLADAADFAAKEQEIAAYVRAWLGLSA